MLLRLLRDLLKPTHFESRSGPTMPKIVEITAVGDVIVIDAGTKMRGSHQCPDRRQEFASDKWRFIHDPNRHLESEPPSGAEVHRFAKGHVLPSRLSARRLEGSAQKRVRTNIMILCVCGCPRWCIHGLVAMLSVLRADCLGLKPWRRTGQGPAKHSGVRGFRTLRAGNEVDQR